MSVALVIAVRGGPLAKSRCAGVLSRRDRQALVAAMLEDMLEAATAVGAVTVITPTLELADLAAHHGARTLLEHQPFGLNAAFAAGRRAQASDTPVLLLPGDLPLIGSEDLEQAVQAIHGGAVVLAPSRADDGTGAIGLPAGVELPLMFGPDSFRRHLAAARAADRPLHIIESGPLGLDIDRPEDLERLLQAGATRSAAVLRRALVPLEATA
ncbi:2-phospho-L-lactate guanylyltransferase [Caulobacter ginsengisoli]|uniref:3-phospho-D-glycerate guanylyltransferase n=1 Tax=Caulobacter ginsengisoli TaxID=400775 RepID=A0ABU0IY35_9CAUL|nr:2-phospho-L-lactate guanylyltransferase [Caulobacter ginsengisoli]MDQ0466916.1 2-phospho-L-lactate guanylyltransferase [Caulobacter ginsengisoli]